MNIDLEELIRESDPARDLLITAPDPMLARTALPHRARVKHLRAGVLAPGVAILVVVAVVAVVLTAGHQRRMIGPAAPAPRIGVVLTQTPDPAGGLPWGVKLVKKGGGLVCLAAARVKDGQLGAVGRFRAFNNDGTFHRLAHGSHGPGIESCTLPDANGNVFASIVVPNDSASGEPSVKHAPVAQRRTLEYGMLGPDAVSYTFVAANGKLVTRPTGEGGSFLIVRPSTTSICRPDGACLPVKAEWSDGSVISAAVTAVNYRDGSACHLVDRLTSMCSAVGRVFAPISPAPPVVPQSAVTSSITATPEPAHSYCEPTAARFSWTPCDHGTPPGDIRTSGTSGSLQQELVRISFHARLATGRPRKYAMSYTNPPGCGGGGGGPVTNAPVHAGQHLSFSYFFSLRCTGRYTGQITYQKRLAPQEPSQKAGAVVVGRFSFTLPRGR